MFVLNINTRHDSLMFDSSEIKASLLLLRIEQMDIFQVRFFTFLFLCIGHINLPHMLSLFFSFFFSYIISLVIHLSPMTNRVYSVVQSVERLNLRKVPGL